MSYSSGCGQTLFDSVCSLRNRFFRMELCVLLWSLFPVLDQLISPWGSLDILVTSKQIIFFFLFGCLVSPRQTPNVLSDVNNGSKYNKGWRDIFSSGRHSHTLKLHWHCRWRHPETGWIWHSDPNHLQAFVTMWHKQSYQNCNYHLTSTHFMTQCSQLKLLWRSSVEDSKVLDHIA